MNSANIRSHFKAKLRRPAVSAAATPWAFIVLPQEASAMLSRRGRVTVEGAINGQHFCTMLEPDGQLSHWLRVDGDLLTATGAAIGDLVSVEIIALDQEPEPDIPKDLHAALAAAPEAQAVWQATTPIARLDWIHWISSAKQAKTRTQRISNACDMLASGKRRVCCFDQSGFYSKALRAPKEAD